MHAPVARESCWTISLFACMLAHTCCTIEASSFILTVDRNKVLKRKD